MGVKPNFKIAAPVLATAAMAASLSMASTAHAAPASDTIHVTGKRVTAGCVAQMDKDQYTYTITPPADPGYLGDRFDDADNAQNAGVTIKCTDPQVITSVVLKNTDNAGVNGTMGWIVPETDGKLVLHAASAAWTQAGDNGAAGNGKTPSNGDNLLAAPINVTDTGYHNGVRVGVYAYRDLAVGQYKSSLVYEITY